MHEYHNIETWYPLIQRDATQFTKMPRKLRENPDYFYESVRLNHEVLNYMGHTSTSLLTAEFLNPYVDIYGKDVLVEIPEYAACWKDRDFVQRCLSHAFIPGGSSGIFNYIAQNDIQSVRTVLSFDTRHDSEQEQKQFELIRQIYASSSPLKETLHAEVVTFVENTLTVHQQIHDNARSVGIVYGMPQELLAHDSIYGRCLDVVDFYQAPALYLAGTQDDRRLQHMLTCEGVNISSINNIVSYESDGKERLNLYGRILALHPHIISELQDILETNKVINSEVRQKQIGGHVCIMTAYAFHAGDLGVIDDFITSHPAHEEMKHYLDERYALSDKMKEQEVEIYL